jgi:ribosomal protein L37AE/L43A
VMKAECSICKKKATRFFLYTTIWICSKEKCFVETQKELEEAYRINEENFHDFEEAIA